MSATDARSPGQCDEEPECVHCGGPFSIPDGYETTDYCNGCAQELAASHDALVYALLVAEVIDARNCPSCALLVEHGHEPDCEIDAGLTAAGYPARASRDAALARMRREREGR